MKNGTFRLTVAVAALSVGIYAGMQDIEAVAEGPRDATSGPVGTPENFSVGASSWSEESGRADSAASADFATEAQNAQTLEGKSADEVGAQPCPRRSVSWRGETYSGSGMFKDFTFNRTCYDTLPKGSAGELFTASYYKPLDLNAVSGSKNYQCLDGVWRVMDKGICRASSK